MEKFQQWLALILSAIISLCIVVVAFLCFVALPWFSAARQSVSSYIGATWGWYAAIVSVLVFVFALPHVWRAHVAKEKHRREEELHKERLEHIKATRNLALQAPVLGFNYSHKNTFTGEEITFGNPFVGKAVQGRTTVQEVPELKELASPSLPTSVKYEDVRTQVPKGHILVGVGRLGVETKDAIVGACLWIVGLSGTGKTSTTVLRVEERAAEGHKFLGADPHWFKPESLTNAVTAYANLFVQPMARTPQEIKSVLAFFLQEFKERKAGHRPKPWQRITLLVDEVGSLMDATDEDEEEVKAMLPSIARICGQEGRNFGMGGIFISQQATGLAWLRKVALMIIVHQLLMDNEKKLATNNDTDAMEDMKSWCIGRTYVYGVGFTDGARTVQQPYFEPASRVVESNPPSQMEDLQPKNTSPLQEQRVRNTTSPSRPFLRVVEVDTEGEHEVATEAVSKGREGEKEQIFLSEREIQIGNMFFGERKMSPTAIAKELWPDVTGGTAFQKNAQIINEAIRKYASQMKVGA